MGDAKRRKALGLRPQKIGEKTHSLLPLPFRDNLTLGDLERVGQMFQIEVVREFAAALDAERIAPAAGTPENWPWELRCAWAYPPFCFLAKRIVNERPNHIPESAIRFALTNLAKGFTLAANRQLYAMDA